MDLDAFSLRKSDYEFERTMRNINADLDSSICTVFLMPPRGIVERLRDKPLCT
jgi:phosphopantetheine adenylyltransferase